MYLQFHGAADGVTGSLHRLNVQGRDILLDCGLFQGHRREADQKNRDLPRWAIDAKALVLSHAHIDHSGNIPTLVKRGFSGHIYCSPPTRDLCSVMLRDSAMIQESDARYLNKRLEEIGRKDPIEPLYTLDDAQRAVSKMISVPLHCKMSIAPGVEMTLHNAGHVLGSSLVELELQENGKRTRLLFSGDLGRAELPLLESPEIVPDVDVLLLESTYGDRNHGNYEAIDDAFASAITQTIKRGGKAFIPTFALERAQEVLYVLARLQKRGDIPKVPIYIDSPLAIAITEVYKLHPESLHPDIRQKILHHRDPFAPEGLRYIASVEESKAIQADPAPAIILAGSGMCEGGRILFHLASGLQSPKNSIMAVGFMAQHTLGRRLIEGKRKVKVLGVERDVAAQVFEFDGLSAHAGQRELVDFAKQTYRAGRVRTVALVHGEDGPKDKLASLLRDEGTFEVLLSTPGSILEL